MVEKVQGGPAWHRGRAEGQEVLVTEIAGMTPEETLSFKMLTSSSAVRGPIKDAGAGGRQHG